MDASQLVRKARLQAGVTQAELARRTGTQQAAIARLERSGANPRVRTLEATLGALGRRLALTAEPQRAAADLEQLRAHLGLSPADRAELHDRSYRNARESVTALRRVP